MLKILLFIGLVLVVVAFFKAAKRRNEQRAGSAPVAPAATAAESMVRCAQCGVHLPRSESVAAGPESFCCEAHRRQRHPAE